MLINKLLTDLNKKCKNTELSEISDCIITLQITKDKVQKIIHNKNPDLAEEYTDAVNDLTVVLTSAVLPNRPTTEEMESLRDNKNSASESES